MRAVAIRDYSGDVTGVVTILRPTDAYGAISVELAKTSAVAALIALLLGAGFGTAIGRGIGRQLAYDAVRRGEIPSIRIGRRVLIPREGFERMLAGSGTEVSA